MSPAQKQTMVRRRRDGPEPGWFERQAKSVSAEVAQWPAWMRKVAGIDEPKGIKSVTNAAFVTIMEGRIDSIRKTLASKAEEYAPGVDCLANFKAAAELQSNTPAQSLLGMLVKHWISIQEMARLGSLQRLPAALINEKIGDAISYLILLEAILKETPS